MSAARRKIKPPVIDVRASSNFFDGVVAGRSYVLGRENFLRCFQNQICKISIQLKPNVPSDYLFFLHVDVEDYARVAWDLPMRRRGDEIFISLDTSRPGVYRLVLKVVDSNKQSYLDQTDEGYLMIDPEAMLGLKMYTLIPAQTGHIGDWIKWLEPIRRMGFNAVHLLPITTMGSSQSPYATKYFSDIDPSYAIPGDPRPIQDQFEDFVEAMKSWHMKLCLDFVLNHVSIDAEFQEKRPDWLYPDPNAKYGYRHAGCWHGSEWLEWEDLLLINYETKNERARHELWNYMAKAAVFWSQYADIIRLDNLHSSHMPFIKSVLHQIRKRNSEIVVLAEFFGNHHDIKNGVIDLGLNLVLATTWDQKFLPPLADYLRYLHSHPTLTYFSMPVSHDSGSALQEFSDALYANLRFFISVMITANYSGVVQGFEYVLPQKLHFIKVASADRVNFSNQPNNISDFMARCHEFKAHYPVLSARPTAIFNTDAVLAVFKQDEKSQALILVNMNIHKVETIELLITGNLKNAVEIFESASHGHFHEGVNQIDLPPAAMQIFLA